MATESVATDEIATPEYMAAQDFDALLSAADLLELEDCAKSFYPNRRIAQTILSKSKRELLQVATQPEEAANSYLHMLEAVQEYQQHLKHQMEQAEGAEIRILCMLATLCPKDDETA